MEIALYRKYRPQKFSEVVGQDHIVSILKGAVQSDAVSHAYLFSGSRGTGKTSVARILAREIGTSANDLYEIDAASNRGIDDVRELREAVNTLPFDSPKKVYIIDEAHMLTKEAFNALLKTLEEPPEHVVFVLATTEMHKLPETVVSRCEMHSFRKPSQQVLKSVVQKVAKSEGYNLEPSAADLIALLGDGSFRDAQGVLQKVLGSITSKNKKIGTEDVARVTGAPRAEIVNDYIIAIDEGNLQKGLSAVRAASESSTDMKVFLKLVLERFRALLLLRHAPDMRKVIEEEMSEEDFKLIGELADKKDSQLNSASLQTLLETYDMVGRSFVPELPLELALIKIIQHNN